MIGTTGRGVIATATSIPHASLSKSSEQSNEEICLSSYEYFHREQDSHHHQGKTKAQKEDFIRKYAQLKSSATDSDQNETDHNNASVAATTTSITHASMQILNRYVKWDTDKGSKKEKGPLKYYYLLGIVKKQSFSESSSYSSHFYLLEENNNVNDDENGASDIKLEIIDELKLIENVPNELSIHILCTKINPSDESDTDTSEDALEGGLELRTKFTNQVVLLRLEEST
jgi:hypothetical protein